LISPPSAKKGLIWITVTRVPSRSSKIRKEDYVRRDFTINALYITSKGEVLDYCGGQKDLKAGLIRFIGDPETRIEEDPLRILRAERFAKKLGFSYRSRKAKPPSKNFGRFFPPSTPKK
jgi:tRNA nucleotidyltransferase/poly(A) polymerase